MILQLIVNIATYILGLGIGIHIGRSRKDREWLSDLSKAHRCTTCRGGGR